MNEGNELGDYLAHGQSSLTLFEGTQNDTSLAPEQKLFSDKWKSREDGNIRFADPQIHVCRVSGVGRCALH